MANDTVQYNIPKLSLNEKINFFSEFHSYLGASIPLTTTLTNIEKYSASSKIKQIAKNLRQDLDRGENFAESILKFKHTIGNVYCNLMSIGAQSGELPNILHDIHDSLKKQRTTLINIIRASAYPAMLLLMLIGSGLLLVFFVAPRLANRYQSTTGEELTQNMTAMQSFANVLTDNIFFIIFVFGLIIWGIISFTKYLLKSELGTRFPVIGAVIRYYNLSVFAKLLAISYAAGLPITHGILLSCESVQNEFVQKKLFKCSTYIAKHPLAESFEGTGLFSPQMVAKLQAGEQTGQLDEALREISNDIDETLGAVLAAALQLLEPLLMIIIAGFIVFYGVNMMNTIFMI